MLEAHRHPGSSRRPERVSPLANLLAAWEPADNFRSNVDLERGGAVRGRSARRWGALLAGVLAVLIAGPVSGSAVPPAPGGALHLLGYVSGRAVTEAGTEVLGCDAYATSTGAGGSAGGQWWSGVSSRFGWWLPAGTYEVRVLCPGARETATVVQTDGGDQEIGDLPVTARSHVSGRVTAAGSGLTGAAVVFHRQEVETSYEAYAVGGDFAVDLPRGRYQVVLRPTGPYTGALVYDDLVVGAGPVDGLEIEAAPGATAGGVVTSEGRPVADATVILRRGVEDLVHVTRFAQTDAAGAWRITGLGPGTYTAEVTAAGRAAASSAPVTIDGTETVEDILTDLAPTSRLVLVTAATTDGAPLEPGATAEAVRPDGTRADAGAGSDSGQYWVDGLAVGGSYALGLNRQSGQSLYTGRYFTQAGRLGSARLQGATWLTAPEGELRAGDLVLDRCASVSGRVVGIDDWFVDEVIDSAAVSVAVYNDDDPDLVTRTAEIADDGTFTVTGLLPGEYYGALRVSLGVSGPNGSSWSQGEEIYGGIDPAVDEPNIEIAADCGEVDGVNFGVPQVVARDDEIVPVTPVRLTDAGVVPAFGQPRCTSVVGAGAPAGASGVLVNVASVSPASEGNVLVFPDDGTGHPTPPAGASVSFETGRDVANAAFVKIGSNGKICVYSQSFAPSRVVVDVSGFTMPDSGIVLQTSTRLLDTRQGAGHVGELAGALAQNTAYEVAVAGRAGVPADAKAVVLNVAAVAPAGAGHLRVYPANGRGPAPDVATVNYAPGRTKSNATVVPLAGGKIGLYSNTFTTTPVDVVLDVTGYVAADGQTYQTVDPERVLDTRPGAPAALRAISTLAAKQVYSLDLRGTDVVPDDATGVVLNVTAIGPTTVGNLRVYPDEDGTGATLPPAASQINYIPGRDIPNLVVVGVPADGRITFYSDQIAGGAVNLAVDVIGYTTG